MPPAGLETAELAETSPTPTAIGSPEVAILLSARNGERFLPDQLTSFTLQTHGHWTLFWRDDGSSDATPGIVGDFARMQDEGRVRSVGPHGHIGITQSYCRLLHNAVQSGCQYFSFADQDDVWLPDKLARGVRALRTIPSSTPALYCARQIVTDAKLRPIGVSPALQHAHFRTAMTQNIASGCTVMLNRTAAKTVLATDPSPALLHDWWCYLVVAGAGGAIVADSSPVMLYRQHGENRIGAPPDVFSRGVAALRRGPTPFVKTMRHHLTALQHHGDLLRPEARADLSLITLALAGGRWQRVRALRLAGFRRQTWLETLLFRIWFIIG